jgi:subtilisin family serine protease
MSLLPVDSGVDVDHEDLKGNIWTNHGEIAGDGIDDDRNGYVDDLHGWNFREHSPVIVAGPHGTHIAGIIGAEWGNGVGIAGVARNVQLMTLEVSSSDESWTRARAVEAIRYAVNNGAESLTCPLEALFTEILKSIRLQQRMHIWIFNRLFSMPRIVVL